MAGYQLEGPKAARMYEVILPKKLGYFGKVQEVLEDLFNEEAIRSIPFSSGRPDPKGCHVEPLAAGPSTIDRDRTTRPRRTGCSAVTPHNKSPAPAVP